MTTIILVIHIIIALFMVGLILIQKSEGGALGIGGGTMGGMMSSRGTANLLTRATAVLAVLFFATTIILAIMFKGGAQPKSIFDGEADQAPISAPLESAEEGQSDAPSVPTEVDAPEASKNEAVTPDVPQK